MSTSLPSSRAANPFSRSSLGDVDSSEIDKMDSLPPPSEALDTPTGGRLSSTNNAPNALCDGHPPPAVPLALLPLLLLSILLLTILLVSILLLPIISLTLSLAPASALVVVSACVGGSEVGGGTEGDGMIFMPPFEQSRREQGVSGKGGRGACVCVCVGGGGDGGDGMRCVGLDWRQRRNNRRERKERRERKDNR